MWALGFLQAIPGNANLLIGILTQLNSPQKQRRSQQRSQRRSRRKFLSSKPNRKMLDEHETILAAPAAPDGTNFHLTQLCLLN
jgi:hypothetical protein